MLCRKENRKRIFFIFSKFLPHTVLLFLIFIWGSWISWWCEECVSSSWLGPIPALLYGPDMPLRLCALGGLTSMPHRSIPDYTLSPWTRAFPFTRNSRSHPLSYPSHNETGDAPYFLRGERPYRPKHKLLTTSIHKNLSGILHGLSLPLPVPSSAYATFIQLLLPLQILKSLHRPCQMPLGKSSLYSTLKLYILSPWISFPMY